MPYNELGTPREARFPRLQERLQSWHLLPRRQAGTEVVLPTPNLLSHIDMTEAQSLIGPDYTLSVLNGNRHKAKDYWTKAGMPYEEMRKLIDTQGRLTMYVDNETVRNMLSLSPFDAGMQMVTLLAPLYDNNNYPLDQSLKDKTPDGKQKGIDGFNAHQTPHIRVVVAGQHFFLSQAQHFGFRHDIDDDTFYAGALGAAGHDVANILTRKKHAQAAPWLTAAVMPELARSKHWERAAQVMVLHNEPEMKTLIKDVWNTLDDAPKTIAHMATLPPEVLATILADKLHIGQDRLPVGWEHADGILRDWNIGVNACFSTTSAAYSPNSKKFTANIMYNPGMESHYFSPDKLSGDLIQPTIRNGKGNKYRMPQAIDKYVMHPDPKKRISHSEVLEAMLWETYAERMRLTIMAAFAFNPRTKTVEINITDPDAPRGLTGLMKKRRIKQVQKRTYKFHRNDIDKQLATIRQGFIDKGIDLSALKEAGTALFPQAL